ncbi:Chromosome partition protein Smc [archaeon HR01]|nr:Chromosome partition protein Smc [archaeon HR01]
MRGVEFIALVVVLALLPLAAYADGYSSIVDNGRIKFSLHYPAEVKIGSCFTLTFQTTIMDSINIERLKLTVTYVSDAGSTNILSDTIISSTTSFTAGDTINKAYSICVPRTAARDPVVVASLFANYTRDGGAEPLTHNWMLAVARERTYDELVRELAEARSSINSLQTEVNNLRAEATALRGRVDSLGREIARLETLLAVSEQDYDELKARYENLDTEFKALNERYLRTLGDLQNLQARYDELGRENQALSANYDKLLESFNSLSDDFKALQASYSQLNTVYQELRDRHEAAKQQIGMLQQQLDDTRKSYDLLQLSYSSLSQENAMTRNLALAQALGLAGISSAAASIFLTKRRGRQKPSTTPSLPPPPPPPPGQPSQGQTPATPTVGAGNGRVQRVLAGRRVTIPAEYAARLGLKEGESISVEVVDDSLVIRPVKT